MISASTYRTDSEVRPVADQTCPDCGTGMQIVHHACENGNLFVWFGCADDDCGGQLLCRIPSTN